MGLSIGPTIGIEGADKFRSEFKAMAATAGMLQSQMDALTASFTQNDSAMKKNAEVSEQLKKQITNQETVVRNATEGYRLAQQALESSGKAVLDAKNAFVEHETAVKGAREAYEQATAAVDQQTEAQKAAEASWREAQDVVRQLHEEFAKGEAVLQREVDAHAELISKNSELVTTYNATKTAYEQASQALDKNVDAQIKQSNIHNTYQAQIDTLLQKLVNLQSEYDKMAPGVESLTHRYTKATEATKELSDAYGRMSPQARGARSVAKELEAELKPQAAAFKALTQEIARTEKELSALEKKDDAVVKSSRELEKEGDRLYEAAEKAEQGFKDAADALDKETRATEEAKRELAEFQKQHNQVSDERKAAQQIANEAEKAYNKEKAATKELTDAQAAAKKEYTATLKEHNALERAIETAEKKYMMAREAVAKWGDAMYTAKAKLSELMHELDNMPSKLTAFGEDVLEVGESLKEVGDTMTKILSPLTALDTYAVKSAMTFTDALAKISTIADTTKVSLDEYSDGIQNLSNETGFAVDDIAAATYQALSAAVSTEDSLEFVAGAANLARAGFLDMYGSVDVLTTILNAYHKDVDEVSDISDVLVKVQDRGKTTVNELAQAMGNVIPTAAQYGIKLEDLGTAYVILTKQGINTARSTTYLRSAFTELEKEGSDASEALKDATGKSFMQLMQEGKTLGQVMQILRDSVNGDEEAFIHLFGSVRTAAGALALANVSAEEYAEILDDVSNSNGQAARNVQKLQTPTLKLKKAWEQLKNTALDLGEEMLEILMPAIDGLVKKVRSMTDAFKKLSKPTKQMIAIFAGIYGALGPVVSIVARGVIGFGKLAKAAGILFGASVSLTAKIAALTAGFAGLVAVAGIVLIRAQARKDAHDAEIESLVGLTDAMKENMQAQKDLIEQHKLIKENAEDNVALAQAQASEASMLVGQYRELLDAKGNVKKGSEQEADVILNLLSQALGMEKQDIHNLIAENGNYKQSIEEIIEAKRKEAEAAAYTQAYQDALKNMVSLEREREQGLKNLDTQHQKTLDLQQQATDLFNQWDSHAGKNAEEQEALYVAYMDTAEAARKSAEKENELKAALDESGQAYLDAAGDVDYMMGKIKEASGMTEEEITKTYGAAEKNAKKSVDNVTKESERMVTESDTNFKAFDTMVERNFTSIEETASTGAQGAANAVSAVDTKTAGQNWIDGIIEGIYSHMALLRAAGTAVGAAVTAAYDAATKTSSPSKVAREHAQYYGDGIVLGLQDRLGDIQAMSRMLGNSVSADASFTNSYSRTGAGYGVTNNNRTISAPISVNVNVNGNLDNPQSLVDSLEEMLVEKIIRNERVFA